MAGKSIEDEMFEFADAYGRTHPKTQAGYRWLDALQLIRHVLVVLALVSAFAVYWFISLIFGINKSMKR